MNDPNLSSFIWSVADLLRGDYKQSEYGRVILPFTVLRRLDCVLEATKSAVLAELEKRTKAGLNPEPFLLRKSGQLFYNTSPLDMKKLMGDQDHIKENLFAYMQGFSPAVRDIFESFDFHTQIDRLAKAGLLYLVSEKFANIDLHPETASNAQMGTVFEELIRKFAELSNETAGEHFTPREVIRLMVNLIFEEEYDEIDAQTIWPRVPAMKPKVIKTQAQYEATLARVEKIFDAKPGTAKGDELELLLLVVETYEDKTYPIELPDPIEALRLRMDQEGLRPKDLIPYIGSKSKVSEVLSGQRPLSLTMIRKLVTGLHLPAEVALGETKPRARGTAPRAGNRRLQATGTRRGSG